MTIVHEFHGGGVVEESADGDGYPATLPTRPVGHHPQVHCQAWVAAGEEPDMVAALARSTERTREDNEICSTWVGSPVSPRKSENTW